MWFFCFWTVMKKAEFKKLFENTDETKRAVLDGLIDEAFDCYMEIQELKEKIGELKDKGVRFAIIAKRERLLVQKRASYTNMMSKICRELCTTDNPADYLDDLGEYE